MNEKIKLFLVKVGITIAIIGILCLSYGGWGLERHFNWKFGYKGKVDKQMQKFDTRLKAVEKELGIEYNPDN